MCGTIEAAARWHQETVNNTSDQALLTDWKLAEAHIAQIPEMENVYKKTSTVWAIIYRELQKRNLVL